MQTQVYFANRRRFLAAAAALGAGAALVPRGAAALSPREVLRRAGAMDGPPDAAWRRLAAALASGGQVLRPWDADYRVIALPNNLVYADVLPMGIARCASAEQVAAAVAWARDNAVPLIVRGGGHSYAGYSTTMGLMIETSLIRQAGYDPNTGVATIGAGARNRDLYDLLRRNGVAVTHGRCPSVGAAGFLLGGGIGFNMREHGLACDQLTSSRLVTADGVIRRLTADAPQGLERELFWGSRGGGGGNFGVSTEFSLKTFGVRDRKLTVFELTWSRTPAAPHPKVPVEVLGERLLSALEDAPRTVGSRVSFGAVTQAQLHAGYDVPISLLGQFAGPRAELERLLKPVTDLVPADPGARIEEQDYWDAQDFLHEDGYPTFYQERSVFVRERFGVAALAAGLAHLRRWPGTYGYCDLRFFQTGGKMNEPRPDATAFVHRDSRWLLVTGLYWGEADSHNEPRMAANHAWQNQFYGAMRGRVGAGGAYQNFADPSLGARPGDADYFAEAYYGNNLGRLRKLKSVADPARTFNFPQAIPPA